MFVGRSQPSLSGRLLSAFAALGLANTTRGRGSVITMQCRDRARGNRDFLRL